MVPHQSGLVATAQARSEVSNWLVLGARGQLGTCLQEALTERGIGFRALGSVECDVTDFPAVAAAVSQHEPTVVVNCSAWTAVDAAEDNEDAALKVNCDGAANVAKAARGAGAILVHISTDYVFPGTHADPYAEDSATGPLSVYGKSKLCGEQRVMSTYPENSYVIRTAWLYSRHGANFARTMLRRALAGSEVRVVDDQFGQPTLADDLANHIIDLVEACAPPGVYHGTNSGSCTWFDFALLLYELAGADTSLVSPVVSAEYPTKAVRPRNSVLGHERTLAAGVAEMRRWDTAVAASIGGIVQALSQENQA